MKKTVILLLLFLYFPGVLLEAEENINNNKPDVSIGINANFGYFDMSHKNLEIYNKPGLYSGGGITIEKMITDNFGFGSGFQYRYFNTKFTMGDKTGKDEVTWTFKTINVPLVMILSLNGENSALNLVGGGVYSHVYSSVMTIGSTATTESARDNVLRFTSTNQIGLTAGIIFKLKTTQYTDFVFGVMGEYYPTNLLYQSGESNDKLKMMNYSLTTGYMFRTNIFPGSTNKI